VRSAVQQVHLAHLVEAGGASDPGRQPLLRRPRASDSSRVQSGHVSGSSDADTPPARRMTTPPPASPARLGSERHPRPAPSPGCGRRDGRGVRTTRGRSRPAVRCAPRSGPLPHQLGPFVDLVGEGEHHLVGVDRSRQPDAGVLAFAVEVGGHQERLGSQRVGVRHPGGGAQPQLEPSGTAPADRQPVRERQRQQRTDPVGRTALRRSRPTGEVAGGAQHPFEPRRSARRSPSTTARTRNARSTGRSSRGPPKTSRSSSRPPPDRPVQPSARRRPPSGPAGDGAAARHRPPSVGQPPVGIDRPQRLEQLHRLADRPVRGRVEPDERRGSSTPKCSRSSRRPARSTSGSPVRCPACERRVPSSTTAGTPRPGPRRPARPARWSGRRLGDADGGEPGHPGAGVETG
jgi:hypothetical protein